MSKQLRKHSAPDTGLVPPELDDKFFQRATRGKYLSFIYEASHAVVIDVELRKDFPDQKAVNEALRLVKQLREIGKKRNKRKTA